MDIASQTFEWILLTEFKPDPSLMVVVSVENTCKEGHESIVLVVPMVVAGLMSSLVFLFFTNLALE